MANTNYEIIQYDPNQSIPIRLNLATNQIIFSPEVDKILQQGQSLVQTGNQLAKTDINQIDETQMTALNKQIRPISKVQTEYENTRKSIKKQLQQRDDEILKAFDDKLNANHFDEIQAVVKKLRALQHDFKANRGNQRWDELHQYFNAQLPLYPELKQYAPKTLANFEFYRINHEKMVSDAKTKPVTKKTIQQLNQDVYNYHLDLTKLLTSTLKSKYYPAVIEQYASEPSTNKMLTLLDKFGTQQIQDDNQALNQKVIDLATQKLKTLWLDNPKINHKFDQINLNPQTLAAFQNYKQQLMQTTNEHILQGIDPLQYINSDRSLKTDKLEIQLKLTIEANFKLLTQKLKAYVQNTPNQPVNPEITPAQPTSNYQWLQTELQTKQMDLHDNDTNKARVLRNLYTTITEPDSIWHNHVKSNHELIGLTRFILNL